MVVCGAMSEGMGIFKVLDISWDSHIANSSNMVDSRNYQQRSQTPTQVLQLLTGQAYYHPPIGMNAYETVNTVTKARPDIGKFLLVKKGKITSVQPHILLALKQPLLPFHSVLSGPLKRVCPVNTHRTLWLTKPLPDMNSDKWCSMVANNPKVVAISVSQKNTSHSIFTITTAYIASQKLIFTYKCDFQLLTLTHTLPLEHA